MRTRHFAQLLGLSALWGASFIFLRIASPALGPWLTAGLRVGLAMLVLFVLMRVMREPWPWAHWRELLVLGTVGVAVPFLLFSWAAQQLPAGYSALLNTTVVLFATLSAAWLKEDTLTLRKLLACVLGFVGVALILRLGPVHIDVRVLAAILACIVASAFYGVCVSLMKRATTRMEPLAIATGMHLAGLPMLLPGALWELPQARFSTSVVFSMFMLGMVASGLAYWLNLRIIRQVSPVAAISPAFMIPVFGVTWGHLFLGEELSSGIFVGGAFVLLATGLVTGFNPLRRWMTATPGP